MPRLVRIKPLWSPGKYGFSLEAFTVAGVKLQHWAGREYPWLEKDERLPVEKFVKGDVINQEHVFVVNAKSAGEFIAVLRDVGKKCSAVYYLVVRVKPGAKGVVIAGEERLFEVEGGEVLALGIGSDCKRYNIAAVYELRDNNYVDVTDELKEKMLEHGWGYAKSSNVKAVHNLVAAWYELREQKPAATGDEQRSEESEEEEDELLREIEEARRRLAQLAGEQKATPAEEREESEGQQEQKPAEAEERREEREGQQPEEAEEQEKPSPFANGDYIVFVNGHPYVRLWLVKAHKVSEYLGSRQQTKANGKGELEIVKKLAPWASKVETARRKMNELLAGSVYVWRGDGYFGYNTSIRIVLSPLGLRELAQAYAIARGWVLTELRAAKAPKEVIEYVEREFKPRPVPMLVPLEAAVAILRAIHAWYVFSEIPRVKQKLREHQQRQNKRMAKKLEAELQALEKQLKALEEALRELEKRYVQSA